MMDAVEYFKIKKRICAAQDVDCANCPLTVDCLSKEMDEPEEVVRIAKEWNEKHPRRTRQDAFLEMYPTAKRYPTGNGGFLLTIGPCELIEEYKPAKWCREHSCSECRKLFWSEEINETD